MKAFILKLILFSIPVGIYCLLAIFVDPYRLFGLCNSFADEPKNRISYKINYPLYKLIEYDRSPCPNVIFGDSRAEKLTDEHFKQLTGLRHFNLAYGGCNIPEMVTTFWEIAQHNKLKFVYIGVNFDQFNLAQNRNRTIEAISLKNSMVLHIFNRYTIQAIFLILMDWLTTNSTDISKPTLDRTNFWQYQLNSTAANLFRVYSYPETYLKDLKKISEYCSQNDIKMIFFSPPTHKDLQQKHIEFGLAEMNNKFRKDISKLGKFVDLDVLSGLTSNKENFLDPFHIKSELSKSVVQKIVFNYDEE